MAPPDSIILVVEDDENDQTFLRRAFKQSGVLNRIVTASDGEEATSYLRGLGAFADRAQFPLPQLIITDLKMPRMNGLDLLSWVKAHDALNVIPVLVLTSSSDQADIAEAFKRGAAGYMIKPVQFGDLEKLVRTIADYWRASCVPAPGPRLPI